MRPTPPLRIERFGRLPRNASETWQGGIVRLPTWVEKGPDGRPYRPRAAVWVSLRTGRMHMKIEPEPEVHGPGLALETLLEFGTNKKLAGCRPARLEVSDEELGAHLVRALGDDQLGFTVSGDLRAVRQVLVRYGEYMGAAPLPPDALDGPGVTIERMRAFAEAAKRFYLAAPWRHLTDEDLIQVDAPRVEQSLRYLAVLGAGGQTFGLGFFETLGDFEAVQADPSPKTLEGRGRWAVWYGPIEEMPFGDVDLWEDHGLPVAGDRAYPVALRIGPRRKIVRPDARNVAYLEGLLLALAETSEEEIDRGRWSHEVRNYGGPTTFTLCIPELLEPPDARPMGKRGGIPDRRLAERALAEIGRFVERSQFTGPEEADRAVQERFSGNMDEMPSTASTPLEKAQDVVYRAFAARGRRRTQLARMALELSPDCADAYVLLAEQSAEAERARDLYAQGVAAGERALGSRIFEKEAGHFWGILATRPYMRARFGLARCLEGLGRTDEAISHYRELLRLNPNDNQGVRHVLLAALLVAGRDDEAGALLRQYRNDASAAWKYGWAFWTFRREGDSQLARDRLKEAVRGNRHVPKYLTGKVEWPGPLPESYTLGSEEEAVICADELADVWQATPGAGPWLAAWKPKRKPQTHR
jgi:hypothetical protein